MFQSILNFLENIFVAALILIGVLFLPAACTYLVSLDKNTEVNLKTVELKILQEKNKNR